MKKIIPVLMCGALITSMAAMTGCGSSTGFKTNSANTETNKGISRTIEKEDKAAFTVAQKNFSISDEDLPDAYDTTVTDATLHIVNDTDDDLVGMFFTSADSDDWGENLLHGTTLFGAGTEGTVNLDFYDYTSNYKMDFVNSNGDADEVDDIDLCNANNLQDITITIEGGDGFYVVEVS